MKSKIIFSLAIIAVCSGCATAPVPTSNAKDIPQNRILSQQYLEQNPNSGEVIVKRDTGFFGSACSSRIFVDGIAIANINPGEKIILYLPLGEHILGSDSGICGGGLSEISILAKKDRVLILRIRYGSNGDYVIQPTAM